MTFTEALALHVRELKADRARLRQRVRELEASRAMWRHRALERARRA